MGFSHNSLVSSQKNEEVAYIKENEKLKKEIKELKDNQQDLYDEQGARDCFDLVDREELDTLEKENEELKKQRARFVYTQIVHECFLDWINPKSLDIEPVTKEHVDEWICNQTNKLTNAPEDIRGDIHEMLYETFGIESESEEEEEEEEES